MSLTRPLFDSACKAYIQKYAYTNDGDRIDNEALSKYPSGWSWNEHRSVLGLGYLARLVSYTATTRRRRDDNVEECVLEDSAFEIADDATAEGPPNAFTCRQYIVFSSTFQVPALYFSMHHNTGAPLTLEEITESPLFRPQALPTAAMTTFALDTVDSAFALLSQGDHPTLGTPCWYLHPCHTAEVVEEIMNELDCVGSQRTLRWLEAWFMVLCNMVDFGEVGR
ncbi:hypothetical protein BC835DRAFT_1268568 [Cytidiella melzeri]|nr:hypothetical protein BC835DRAFT_1268568 [Cytidiella melzeri]